MPDHPRTVIHNLRCLASNFANRRDAGPRCSHLRTLGKCGARRRLSQTADSKALDRLSGARHGFLPVRKGQAGQVSAVPFLTSAAEPPRSSRDSAPGSPAEGTTAHDPSSAARRGTSSGDLGLRASCARCVHGQGYCDRRPRDFPRVGGAGGGRRSAGGRPCRSLRAPRWVEEWERRPPSSSNMPKSLEHLLVRGGNRFCQR